MYVYTYVRNYDICIYINGKNNNNNSFIRIDNLNKIKQSINFEYVDEWLIVYDGNRIETNPYIFKENEKMKEYI